MLSKCSNKVNIAQVLSDALMLFMPSLTFDPSSSSRATAPLTVRSQHKNSAFAPICSNLASFRMTSIAIKSNEDPDKNSDTSDTLFDQRSAPDGGWGWMCVLGCTLMHFLVVGYNRSYGIIYMQLRSRFHSSAALTAWVGGTCIAIRLGLSEWILPCTWKR